MSGGGSKPSASSQAPAVQAVLPPVTAPTFTANTTMPVGYQFPQNPGAIGSASTGIGTGAPDWAQGAWAMPWWGQSAPQTGQAILQAQQQGAYAPMAPAPAQAAPAPAPAATPEQTQLAAMIKAGYSPEVAQAILTVGGLGQFGLVPGQDNNGSTMQLGQRTPPQTQANYALGYRPDTPSFWGNEPTTMPNLGWS
jgi:hypothetical protein